MRIGDLLARLSVVTGAYPPSEASCAAGAMRGVTDGWELVAYFSAAEARKLEKGMDAVVTPSTVKAEREGGIRGKVTAVGTDFETPESIQCDFRNNAFTQWIMSRTDGMPVKVRMLLESDPAAPSGFRWTGGGGPDIRIADGTVEFDGRPRRAYSRRTMRRDFAMVDQEISLFSATVRENLTMFDETIPLADVVRAADDAGIGDVVRGRRGGFGAMVKGDGAEFSGGERQRLEIARALVTDPKVLVLDRGTHDELMSKNGAYAKLVRNEG